jgi:hypothetical protein
MIIPTLDFSKEEKAAQVLSLSISQKKIFSLIFCGS